MRGQTLVEFALVLPIFLALMLGFAELAMLFASRQGYQNGVDVLAQSAAINGTDGWSALVADEQQRTGCGADPVVTYPDGTNDPGDRVHVRWDCHYTPKVAPGWGGLTVHVESEAVVPGVKIIPSPTASPS